MDLEIETQNIAQDVFGILDCLERIGFAHTKTRCFANLVISITHVEVHVRRKVFFMLQGKFGCMCTIAGLCSLSSGTKCPNFSKAAS